MHPGNDIKGNLDNLHAQMGVEFLLFQYYFNQGQ